MDKVKVNSKVRSIRESTAIKRASKHVNSQHVLMSDKAFEIALKLRDEYRTGKRKKVLF